LTHRRIYVNLAVFGVIFLVMLVEATRSIISVGAIQHPYPLSAEFPNAFGVLVHSEVDYLAYRSERSAVRTAYRAASLST